MGLVLAEVAEVVGAHVIVFFAIFLEVIQQKKKKNKGEKNGVERKKSQPRDRGKAHQKEGNKMEEKEKNSQRTNSQRKK